MYVVKSNLFKLGSMGTQLAMRFLNTRFIFNSVYLLFSLILISGCKVDNTIRGYIGDTVPSNSPTLSTATYVNIANQNSFSVSGTCPADALTISLTANAGAPTIFNCVSNAYSGALDLSSLADGAVTLVATPDTGTAKTAHLIKDTVAPTVAITSPATNSYINLASDSSTYAVTGTCSEASQAVTIKVDGSATGTGATCSGTNFSATINSTTLTAGTHSILATISDTAGNPTNSTSISVMRDVTSPALSFSQIISTPIAGGASFQIIWTATEFNTSATDNFTLEYYNGSSWQAMTTVASANGPIVLQSFSYTWTIPSIDTASAKVRVSLTDSAGNTSTLTSNAFTIDSTAPVLTSSQFTLNSGAASTSNPFIQVALAAADSLSKISYFCLKYNLSTTPLISDGCWVAVNANPPALTPALTLNLSAYYFQLGVSSGTYTVYGWVRDEAGNISTLTSSGAGTSGKDKADIIYTQSSPPVITDVWATSTDSPSQPFAPADLTVAASGTVYVKWHLSSAQTLAANPVSLYYTTDDANYTLIASSITNTANAGCTITATHTGCYTWSGGAPGTYFKVRVVGVDTGGTSAVASSVALNVAGVFNFLAGNTDPGQDGSAGAAMFINYMTDPAKSDTSNFVVTNDGTIYFRDMYRGILKVNPTDGKQTIFIPTTGVQSGDGGPATSATLNSPIKMVLDHNNRLLIFDYNRIRRVDLNATPATIDTFIGGGSSAAEGITPSQVKISAVLLSANWDKHILLMALPNGDVYFQDSYYETSTAGGNRVRIYKQSTGLVTSLNLTGTGDAYNASQDISQCRIQNVGFTYDPTTSNLTSLTTEFFHPSSSNPLCVGGDNFSLSNLDPYTGVAAAPFPTTSGPASPSVIAWGGSYRHSGLNGKLYLVSRNALGIYVYDNSTYTWNRIAGTGNRGVCADGTLATSCDMDPLDVFVNAQSKIYFVDRGRIRMIDSSNKVYTLAGQSFFFGDGGTPLSARFGEIGGLRMWNDAGTNKYVVLDTQEHRFREFTSASIQGLAGDGGNSIPNTTSLANAQSVYIRTDFSTGAFELTSTGDILFPRSAQLSRLDRTLGKWQDIAGGGATPYSSADGLIGSAIQFIGYYPIVIGFTGTQILAALDKWPSLNDFFKYYSLSNGTQTHVAGVSGTSPGICADGTNTASCSVPNSGSVYPASYDSISNRWFVILNPSPNILRVFNIGGTMNNVATLPHTPQSIAYVRDAGLTVNKVYYCATDGRIYKYDLNTTTETALTWPISTLSCASKHLIYNSSSNTLVFPYTQNGLYGVVEYLAP